VVTRLLPRIGYPRVRQHVGEHMESFFPDFRQICHGGHLYSNGQTERRTLQFAEGRLWNIRRPMRASRRLEASKLPQLGPLRNVFGKEFAELDG
jgi:hypothetical protein